MRTFLLAILVMGSVAGLAACGKGKGGGGGDDMTGKLTEFKDAMCKCKDTACADKVIADQGKWTAEMSKKNGPTDPDKAMEMAKKYEAITTEFGKCMAAAMAAPAPTP